MVCYCSGGECWRGYLHTQVDDGKSAVQTRFSSSSSVVEFCSSQLMSILSMCFVQSRGCPQHKCCIVVPTAFFSRFCDEERQKKYQEGSLDKI